VRALLEIVDERIARRAGMDVGVDDRRHQRLAGETHARRAGRRLDVPRSHQRNARAVDHDGRVLDHLAVADDDAAALKYRYGGLRTEHEC
jgi:hypothetical protein